MRKHPEPVRDLVVGDWVKLVASESIGQVRAIKERSPVGISYAEVYFGERGPFLVHAMDVVEVRGPEP